jgi:hypothetical protein
MAITQNAANDIVLGSGGSYGTDRDVLKHYIWDTRPFSSPITGYTFFSQQLNAVFAGGTLKTLSETNMLDSGKFPSSQTFIVKRMGVSVDLQNSTPGGTAISNQIACFFHILQHSIFEFKIAGREWDAQIHGRQFMPSNIAMTGAGAEAFGSLVASGWISLEDSPIPLESMATFSVQHTVVDADPAIMVLLNAAAQGIAYNSQAAYMRVILEGTLTRGK